jgi:EAL domain-containing protein (putative c-di-GMP-specific phosphodiesterase class I)
VHAGEFVLHYQPKMNLVSGAAIGIEALIRWRAPDGRLIPPAEFIPAAEKSGLIIPIGEWALREACRQNRAWRAEGLPALPVSVNVSAAQFRRKDFLDVVTRVLRETGHPPEQLELELTESILMEDGEHTISVLRALKAMGLRVSIDDFGTGYSSLSYLKRFPIDTLKIDQSFVRDIDLNPDQAAIVRAVITMTKSLKQRIIAEGVETAGQQAFLLANGCDEIQGFLFSEPMPADELSRFVRGNRANAKPVVPTSDAAHISV